MNTSKNKKKNVVEGSCEDEKEHDKNTMRTSNNTTNKNKVEGLVLSNTGSKPSTKKTK